MARIEQTKNTALPSWKVSWVGDTMSRSKAIRNREDALKFKNLVEEAGDQMPAISVLAENGLIDYADWLSPKIFIELRKLVESAPSDKSIAAAIRETLHQALDVPR